MVRLRAFFRFWSDFLVGDRPELFVGPILSLLAVGLLVRGGLEAAVAGVLLTMLVMAVGALSVVAVLRGR